jgi:hypothetical protein
MHKLNADTILGRPSEDQLSRAFSICQCVLLYEIYTQELRIGRLKFNFYKSGDVRKRNGEGLGLGLGIAPPVGKTARGSSGQSARIRARHSREQAASPPSTEHGRAARALGADRDKAPGSRQPRAGNALADPLLSARP